MHQASLDGAGEAPPLLDGAGDASLLDGAPNVASLPVDGSTSPLPGGFGDAPSRHLDASASHTPEDLDEFCNNHVLTTDIDLPAFDTQLEIEELDLSFDMDMDLIDFLKH